AHHVIQAVADAGEAGGARLRFPDADAGGVVLGTRIVLRGPRHHAVHGVRPAQRMRFAPRTMVFWTTAAGSRETRSLAVASGPMGVRRRFRCTALTLWRAAFSGVVVNVRAKSRRVCSGSSAMAVTLSSMRAFLAMLVLMPPGWMVVAL